MDNFLAAIYTFLFIIFTVAVCVTGFKYGTSSVHHDCLNYNKSIISAQSYITCEIHTKESK